MWHAGCVNLTGLNKVMINRLVDYLCPLCYVATIPTQVKDLGTCLVCRNTGTRVSSHLSLCDIGGISRLPGTQSGPGGVRIYHRYGVLGNKRY